VTILTMDHICIQNFHFSEVLTPIREHNSRNIFQLALVFSGMDVLRFGAGSGN
jgi:hypothetical protein